MQNSAIEQFNKGLIEFLASSPTPYHATENMAERLAAKGFVRLNEAEPWQLEPGKGYFVTRNDSSIIAFRYGSVPLELGGIRMFGAHTDSPCLKLRPNAYSVNVGYGQLAVEVYGGVLLNTWFDRDLSIAGRVTYSDETGAPRSCLIDFARPVACLPNIAIHLDREANRNKSINPQKEVLPVLMLADDDSEDWQVMLKAQTERQHPQRQIGEILDFELSLYDTQKPGCYWHEQGFYCRRPAG